MATLEQGGGVGEYRIGRRLRSGTAGTIFLGEQPTLSRPVALQVASSPADSLEGKRFLEVARLLARVHHPHLLELYDVDVDGDVPFAVMREPPGQSLRTLVAAGGPLERARAARLAEQLAAALETLDGAGVSFEHVSPDNIFLEGSGDDEHVYLAPLEELLDADASSLMLESRPDRSAAALAGLLSSVIGTSEPVSAGPTPSAVAVAARRALVPDSRRRRRVIVWLAAVLTASAAAVVVAIVVERGGGNESAAAQPTAQKIATILLGATSGSLTVSRDSVWVATTNGTAVRVDPRTNQVVGQPIRFGKPSATSNLTIRAGAGYVFALDGSAGLLARIDPRRNAVTGRLHLSGYLDGAAVADGAVWVLRSSPDGVQPPWHQLIRLDPSTLKQIGKPYPIGAGALDVEVRDRVAWVTNAGDGTETRIDTRDGSVTTVRLGAQPMDSVLRGKTLWAPDVWGDGVVLLDTSLRRPPTTVVRGLHHPYSVVKTAGALWVASLAGDSTNAPAVLWRVDPVSAHVVGRPVPLGQLGGWIASGFGSIWVQDQGAKALLRFDPTSLSGHAPPGPRPASSSSTRTLVPGPLDVGTWRLANPRIRFGLRVGTTGWMEVGPTTYGVEIGRFEAPETTLSVVAPTQLFLRDGGVEKLPTATQIVRAFQANPHLVVRMLPNADVGGVSATRLSISVKPYKGYPTFCPDACVPIFGWPNNTTSVEERTSARLSLVEVRGRTIAVLEQADRVDGSLATTGTLVRSLSFR